MPPSRMLRRPTITVIFIATCLLWAPTANTAREIDFGSCSSSLADIGPAAEAASDNAQEAERTEQAFDDAKEEFDRCRRDPETYDTYSDGCRHFRREVEDARYEFNGAIDELESALHQMDGEIRYAHGTCGYETAPQKR
jgi:hypothetical protein